MDSTGLANPIPVFTARHFAGAAMRQEKRHVGDSLIDDVQGAQGAGICAVWLNRQGIANDTTIQPDAVIFNLRQLSDSIG